MEDNTWLVTAVLALSYLASGLNFSILSPLQLTWAQSLGTDIYAFSSVFTWRSTGYVFGCIFGCVLFRYINRQVCLAFMYLLIAITLSTATMASDLSGIVISLGLQGIFTGVCDAATSAIMCQVLKERAGPFLQVLYLSFGLGCTLAPLMAAPLLDNFKTVLWMTSGLVLFSSISLLSLLCLVHEVRETDSQGNVTSTPFSWTAVLEWTKTNLRTVILVILTSFIILFLSGMEITYWEFLPAYLQQVPFSVMVSGEKASYMTSAANYGFMMARGVGIFLSARISPLNIILFDLLLLGFSCLLLLINGSLFVLWFCNITIGVAFGTLYPQIYALIAKEIMVTNYYSSLFAFCSGVTAALYPGLVSYQISRNHQFLVQLVLANIIVAAILLGLFVLVVRHFGRNELVKSEDIVLEPHINSDNQTTVV